MILTKEIKFIPAFDKRDSDPSKNYGIHGVDLEFLLHGEKGTVRFLIFTGWMLPHIKQENITIYPMAADLGYHAKFPQYEGHEPVGNICEYTKGPCFYDGSSLNAEELFKKFTAKGVDIVWETLEDYYNQLI